MLARRRREKFWGPDPEAGGGGSRGIHLMGPDFGRKKSSIGIMFIDDLSQVN